jgi:L-lactate dehydrogenase (cytochrome)
MAKHRSLADALNIMDLLEMARKRLPGPLFDYLDGGAETEFTTRRNTLAFDQYSLVPRCLIDVSSISTTTRVLGHTLAWPVICSPTGASRFYHPDGELAVAHATAATGTLYGLSVMSTHSLEEVAAATEGPKFFQLLVFKDRELTHDLMARAKRAGYQVLCLTIDAPVRGKRERELRRGLGLPIKPSLRSLAGCLVRPRWFFGQLRGGPLSLPHMAARTVGAPAQSGLVAQSRYAGTQLDPSVTWKDVRALIEKWNGPFALKGVLSADDARLAVDAGATALIVSNHGGRQLDGAITPIEVLPEIVQTVGDRVEVILDGGIRRGTHVLKALSLGAKACSIGRPYLFGLAAGGAAGVQRALDILREEFVLAMQLCGCADVAAIRSSLIRWHS